MQGCLFCGIAEGTVPAEIVWSDDEFVAFRDIDPQAPVHVLVIPRHHAPDLAALSATDAAQAGRLLAAVAAVAHEEGLDGGGYRTVLNTGVDGGQTVSHVHAHVLGGRQMMWPPG